jgi:hypothetical protein
VTITAPVGATGTVSGLLNLVTTPLSTPVFTTTGDVLATVPYSYQAS